MRRMLWLVVLAGCPASDETEHREGLYCGNDTLDLLPPELQSTNPFQRNERVIDGKVECWSVTTEINETKDTATMDWALISDEGPPLLGCAFHGTGSSDVQYSTGIVTFSEGSCVIPTMTGHIRFALTGPATYDLTPANQIDFPTSWQEVRGEDLITGTGRLFWSRPMTPLTTDKVFDPRTPTDPNASCRMPACSTVALAGKGTVVTGGAQVCNELLASYAEPFNVYFDDANAMSFSADGSSPMPGVLDKTTCGASTWLGERPYPIRRYHLDANGTFTIDETVLHQANSLSDVCTLRWETTVTGC